jgi:hypothetical protein
VQGPQGALRYRNPGASFVPYSARGKVLRKMEIEKEKCLKKKKDTSMVMMQLPRVVFFPYLNLPY